MVETIEDPNTFKEKGNEAFKSSEWDEAIKFYTKAIKFGEKHKELPVFYKNRAAAYLKTESFERAYDDCTKSLELQSNDQKALFRRVQALEAMERYEEAYRDARTIWNNEPTFKAIQPVLERLHKIVQTRVADNAQTSTKVRKMFEIAFDISADRSKRETAMSNLGKFLSFNYSISLFISLHNQWCLLARKLVRKSCSARELLATSRNYSS